LGNIPVLTKIGSEKPAIPRANNATQSYCCRGWKVQALLEMQMRIEENPIEEDDGLQLGHVKI